MPRRPPSNTLAMAIAIVIAIVVAGCSTPAPSGPTPPTTPKPSAADYGDAPDGDATDYPQPFAQTGSFPTNFASNGARAEDIGQARLGDDATTEADALAPDADDGLVQLVMLLTSIPPPATLTVQATAPAGSAGGTFYLNVLIDLTMDGRWGGLAGGNPEWVTKNQAVTLAAGQSLDVQTATFAFSNGLLLPDGAWMRVALTKEQVKTTDWDGTGQFTAGEVEDHVISLPEPSDKKPAIPIMTCPANVEFPAGATTVDVECTIVNIAPVGHGSDVRWELSRIDGGVTIATTEGDEVVAPQDPVGVKVKFTATKGQPLPSTWAYSAVGIDPPSVVTTTGIEVGYGESEGEVEFSEAALACYVLISIIETGREHYTGESDAIWWIQLAIQLKEGEAQRSLAGATVTATTNSGQKTGTTDASGRVEIRERVYSYGNYPLTVTDVKAQDCAWDKEKSQTTATADVS